ncbi:MAG TPA: cell division protein ZapA [Acidiferrobacteraceae bacterium]|nr:MAG: cell division protein ZapA [Gammaproteobacteria bacterium]HDO78857.1 cell division protein ZapA [Acidiferrobacteraceae bacterium]HEX19854.1 cell division protein ZapA [Acidiferrobacteraceae bacterium]
MKTDQEGVKVSILGKEFVVACPDNEKNALLAAASYLDEKMRAIQDSGKVIGAERCAVMAALNIAHDFLDLQQNSGVSSEMAQKLRFLQTKIEAALHS